MVFCFGNWSLVPFSASSVGDLLETQELAGLGWFHWSSLWCWFCLCFLGFWYCILAKRGQEIVVEGDCSKTAKYLWCTQISTRAQILLWNLEASLLDVWLPQASLKLQSFDSFKVSVILIKKANWGGFVSFWGCLCRMQRVGTTLDRKFSASVCCMWSDVLSVVVCVFTLIYFGFSGTFFFVELAKTAGVGVCSMFLCSHRIMGRDVS